PAVPIDDVATQPEQPAGGQQPPSSEPSISATPLSEADVLWSLQSADAKDLDELVPAAAGRPAPGQDAAAFATELKNQQVDRAYKEVTSNMATLDIANVDPVASFDTFAQGPAAWNYVDGRAPPIADGANQASA
ncbi:MAG: hypothetical protein Q9192_008655, partial [Flavoplaca navasiana]